MKTEFSKIPPWVKPYVIRKNRLNVLTPSLTLKAINEGNIDFTSISSIRIYLAAAVVPYDYYGIPHQKSITVYTQYDVQDNIAELIRTWYNYKKTRRIVIVRNYYDKTARDITNSLREFCKARNYPDPCVIGIGTRKWFSPVYLKTIYAFSYKRNLEYEIFINESSRLYYIRYTPEDKRIYSDRNIPLICSQDGISKNGILTVEDYTKWYNLFLVKRTDKGEISVEKYENYDIQWYDHVPEPKSVIEECAKHGIHLGYVSYLAICCRFAEDYLYEDDPINIPIGYLPSTSNLLEVLVQDFGFSKYFNLPWVLPQNAVLYLLGDNRFVSYHSIIHHINRIIPERGE